MVSIMVLVLTRRGGCLSRFSNFNRKYYYIAKDTLQTIFLWFCPHWTNNVILSQKHNVMEKIRHSWEKFPV